MTENEEQFICKFVFLDDSKGFHLIVTVDGKPELRRTFDTREERQRAHDHLVDISHAAGAVDMPVGGH